jgi:ElaB/YqjD/DUF883 family membrane-anchored ribosome-binding protein
MSKLGDNLKSATGTARQSIAHASGRAREAGAAAKRSASAVAEKGKNAAARGVESSKQLAKKAGKASADGIDKNPLAIVAGGIAIGAIIGMLLPKSEREQQVLGKAGKAINDTAKRAVNAAKDAGKAKVDEVGLGTEAMREQFRDLVGKASEAVKAAGKAAADEARKRD